MDEEELPRSVSLLHFHHLSRQHAALLRSLKTLQSHQEKLDVALGVTASRADLQRLQFEYEERFGRVEEWQKSTGESMQRLATLEEVVRVVNGQCDGLRLEMQDVQNRLSALETAATDQKNDDKFEQLSLRLADVERKCQELQQCRQSAPCDEVQIVPSDTKEDDIQHDTPNVQIPITISLEPSSPILVPAATVSAVEPSVQCLQTSTLNNNESKEKIEDPSSPVATVNRISHSSTNQKKDDVVVKQTESDMMPIKSVRLRSGTTFNHITAPVLRRSTRSIRTKREVKAEDESKENDVRRRIVILKVKWPQETPVSQTGVQKRKAAPKGGRKPKRQVKPKARLETPDVGSEQEL